MVSPGATCCQNDEVVQHQQPLLFLLLLSLLYQLVAPLGSTHRYPNHSGLEMAFAHPKISFGSRLSIDTSLRKFPAKRARCPSSTGWLRICFDTTLHRHECHFQGVPQAEGS
jgi:hypothetical protein